MNLLDFAAQLRKDDVQARETAAFRQQQAAAALRQSQIQRTLAYAGAGLVGLVLIAVTVRLAQQSRTVDVL